MNVIIQENLFDHDHIEHYSLGFEGLKKRAATCMPEWAEGITGISAAAIRQLAREYPTTKPAGIRMGVALERHAGGGQTTRALMSGTKFADRASNLY